MIARRPLGRSPAGECQHGAILSALMVLMLAAPAGAIITDVEPSNDTVSTAPSQFIKTGDLTIDGGDLELVAGDIDFIGMAALSSGVVVSVTTTPLDDVDLKVLDTMMGLFNSSATEPTHMILCRVDDAPNNDLITSGGGVGDCTRAWFALPLRDHRARRLRRGSDGLQAESPGRL